MGIENYSKGTLWKTGVNPASPVRSLDGGGPVRWTIMHEKIPPLSEERGGISVGISSSA
ncbi:MAG: hypothetical protein UY74_C0035G0002 [Candidatus Kaiserbacteria bacterium GW2011_GWC2_52_8b]|uniref:Uncharacterized protein n=1 Tax=Candidatus Kaiserbacteria bacterium GW2011_GWC2_52_8b TaxID=1618676 RepID=A0A0G1XHD1_9BACT|nr:MAG: hypothetical protein UY74_C0035G0002 [Candidatus Kaiserbacteria bacterium GW2011_GWC2_52_8b]